MKAEAFREALRAMPLASPQTVTRGKPLVVLAPHPDDESLGLGGLIAASCEAGVDVRLVVVSDGAQSHPGSKRFPPDRLASLRREEMEEAARHLGLSSKAVTHLDLPDTMVPSRGPSFEAAVASIAAMIDDARAASLFAAWGCDPHCDHEATARIAHAVRERRPGVALWTYPVWGWHLDAETEIDAPAPTGFRLGIDRWLPAKRAAIASHASQMTDLIDDDPSGFRFTPEMLAPFLQPTETVFEMPP